MVGSAHWLPSSKGRLPKLLLGAALAFVAAVVVSLAASGQAKAAECMSWTECYNNSQWERMIATQRFNEGVLYKKAADQEFARGNASAAVLYKTASDQKFNEASWHSLARDQLINRGIFLAGGVGSIEELPADPGDALQPCDPGDEVVACAAGARKTCKRAPIENRWRAEIAGSDVYRATVKTMWCWRGDTIVSRNSNWGEHYVTSFGSNLGLRDSGVFVDDSYCTDSPVENYTCITRFQYGFKTALGVGSSFGGCIGTRIWGASRSPNHLRRAYGGRCAGD